MPEATNERIDLIKKLYDEAISNDDVYPTDNGQKREEQFQVKENQKKWCIVVNLPHENFHYNVENTRINASREQWEAQNPGQILNAVDHADKIEQFLMENPTYGQETTEELEADVLGPDYLKDPILITEDGVVWNGNRRLAIVRKLKNDSTTYESRFEKVPTCILPHMEFDQLKALEGILQVEKSFKKQYGTFEIRIEIRRRRLGGDSWGKIKKQFADAYDENALKTMLSEIQFVDEVLEQVNKPKDYTWAAKMGSSGRRGGIEIWKIPHAQLKRWKQQLVEKEVESGGVITTVPVANPNPTLYHQRQIQWIQHLLNPDVSHDTIRRQGDVMNHDKARADYDAQDGVMTNYAEQTTTMVQQGGREIPLAFTVDEVKKANDLTDGSHDLTKRSDPKDFAKKAIEQLKKIKDEKIPHNNPAFQAQMANIQAETDRITANPTYSSSDSS